MSASGYLIVPTYWLFQPRNDTQTSMVLLRHKAPDEIGVPIEYPIFFAVTRHIGHDKRGNRIHVRDSEGNDALEETTVKITVVEEGSEVEKVLTERVPIIDDELPPVPAVFMIWARDNYIGV